MDNRLSQLKQNLRKKIDKIQDADYLTSLDAILTFETVQEKTGSGAEKTAKKSSWLWFWQRKRFE